ncbi:MAG: TIGR00725 family protein [Promethearchaeota archaeon]
MKLRITVIGSSGKVSSSVEELAVSIGREVAKAGAILITGGRDGVMEAATRGAKNAGGLTVGILGERTLEFANPHLEVGITTGLGYARNYINICSGDAIISVSGAGGTLSELGFAIALDKVIVLMEGTGGVTDIITQALPIIGSSNIFTAKSAEDAIGIILSYIKAG